MALSGRIRQLRWHSLTLAGPCSKDLAERRASVTLALMSKTRTEVLAESTRKGIVAGVATAGAVAAGVVIAPVAGAVVAVPAALFAWRWWKHRAENGIKF